MTALSASRVSCRRTTIDRTNFPFYSILNVTQIGWNSIFIPSHTCDKERQRQLPSLNAILWCQRSGMTAWQFGLFQFVVSRMA